MDNPVGFGPGRLHFQLTGFDLGQVQDIVDQFQQVGAAGMNGIEIPQAVRRIFSESPFEDFRETEDGVHRRSDFMAHIGQKSALGLVGGFGLLFGLAQLDLLVLQPMPFSTQLLLGISHGLRDFWWLIIAVIGTIIYLSKKYVQTPAGRLKTDRMKVNSPVIGTLVKSVEAARFTRTLGTLINSGVPILQALRLVQEIITNQQIAGELETVYHRVKEGDNLSAPLLAADIFPPLAVQMISVGEQTGKLDEMLLRVAENYEKTVRNMIKRFVSLLEPVMILGMGLMVGFIVISMLLAVFSMNEVPF